MIISEQAQQLGRVGPGVMRNDRPSGPLGPRLPVRPAPAHFGAAGISAGEDQRWKTRVRRGAPRARDTGPDRLARGLGWFSIGLGAIELIAARDLAWWLGAPRSEDIVRAYGAREVANGVGILSTSRPKQRARWVWARVAGDALDLATLGAALTPDNPRKANVAVAMAAVAGITAVDVVAGLLMQER